VACWLFPAVVQGLCFSSPGSPPRGESSSCNCTSLLSPNCHCPLPAVLWTSLALASWVGFCGLPVLAMRVLCRCQVSRAAWCCVAFGLLVAARDSGFSFCWTPRRWWLAGCVACLWWAPRLLQCGFPLCQLLLVVVACWLFPAVVQGLCFSSPGSPPRGESSSCNCTSLSLSRSPHPSGHDQPRGIVHDPRRSQYGRRPRKEVVGSARA